METFTSIVTGIVMEFNDGPPKDNQEMGLWLLSASTRQQ